MNLLAIETSCDETAAAVVAETGTAAIPWKIRSNVVASQVAIHREWGGVVPELASRQHVRDICGVYEAALEQAYAEATDAGARVVRLDFAGVGYINSTGIALLVGLLAHGRRDHVELEARGLSDHYREIFEITRIADFVRIVPDGAAS